MAKHSKSIRRPSQSRPKPRARVSNYSDQSGNGGFFKSFIDLDSLESLVDSEDLGEGVCGPGNIRQDTEYGVPSVTRSHSSGPKDSQLITFYSSSSNSSLRSPSFKDMFTTARKFQETLLHHYGNSIWWMDVQNPSEKSLRLLCSAFHVHPLTVEDIRMQETHEKMDHFPSYSFVCLRTFTVVTSQLVISYEPQTIYMVMFKEGTLTFSFSKTQHSTHVLDRIATLQDYIPITQNWLFYAFVDDIVDSFDAPIAQVDSEVNLIDDQIYTTRIEDLKTFLLTIEDVRVRVSSLLRLMGSKKYILNAFDAHRTEAVADSSEVALGEDIHLYIGDVQDHVVTMISSLKHFERILSRAQKNCLAQLDINNDMARRRVVKFLGRVTVLTIILSLLNLICGLFSTNVNANTTLYATNSLKSWFIIISLELLLAITLFFLAKRYRLW